MQLQALHASSVGPSYFEQLHAYYIILQAFTVDFMQLQALHASSVGPTDFEIRGSYRVSM